MSNILVLSFAISPVKGSEFSVGWNYINHMRKYHQLFVLYAELADDLQMEDYLSGKRNLHNVKFFYCGKKKNLPKKVGVIRDFYESYRETKKLHRKALSIAKNIIETEKIDCVHYLNPIGFKEPSTLWKLDVPYVWGPVQTVSSWPFFSFSYLSIKGKMEFLARLIFHNWHFYFNKTVHKAFRRADAVVAATPFSKIQIEKLIKRTCFYTPENAVDADDFGRTIQYDGGGLKLFFAGSLIDRKGLFLVLGALKELKNRGLLERIELHVFGTGYLENSLKARAQRLGVDSSITWHGFVNRDELQVQMESMHLNVITSLSEATTTILWEASCKGIPTLTLNHCGMQGVLNSQSAFLINVTNAKKIVSDISDTVKLILDNPSKIEEKSKNLGEVVRTNSWSNKELFWNSVYNQAVEMYNVRLGGGLA